MSITAGWPCIELRNGEWQWTYTVNVGDRLYCPERYYSSFDNAMKAMNKMVKRMRAKLKQKEIAK